MLIIKKVKDRSDEIIQKIVILRQTGGNKVLTFARKYLVCVASHKTLCRVIENLKTTPGIKVFDLNVPKALTKDFTELQLI